MQLGTLARTKKKRLCFRLGASTWQPRDCKNSFWRGFLDTPLAKMCFFFWGVNSLGPTPCKSSVQNWASGSSTSQKDNLLPTKGLPRAPGGRLFPQAESPQRILCHSLVSSVNNAFSSSCSFVCKLRQTFFPLPSCLTIGTAADPLSHVPLVGFLLGATLHSLASLGLTLCSDFHLPFLHWVSCQKGLLLLHFTGLFSTLYSLPALKHCKQFLPNKITTSQKVLMSSATGAL